MGPCFKRLLNEGPVMRWRPKKWNRAPGRKNAFVFGRSPMNEKTVNVLLTNGRCYCGRYYAPAGENDETLQIVGKELVYLIPTKMVLAMHEVTTIPASPSPEPSPPATQDQPLPGPLLPSCEPAVP